MTTVSLLILFGGESSEHDVSIASAKNIFNSCDPQKYDITLCYIPRSGIDWKIVDSFEALDTPGVSVWILPGQQVFMSYERKYLFDVAFPVLHGKNGEDGSVQGLLEMMHIPYVGCGIESSALCMDKHRTKQLLRDSNLPVVQWASLKKGDIVSNTLFDTLQSKILFVKPSRAGSSVGVSRVENASDLKKAVALAHEHDDVAIIEPAVIGRELEVSVLGNVPTHTASGVGEIIVPLGSVNQSDSFYSYDQKYSTNSHALTSLTADLSHKIRSIIRHMALDAYTVLGCSGLARVDFFMTEDEMIYINEINTIPGFTSISMYPKLWDEAGISNRQLVDRLIDLAIEKTYSAQQ